MTRKTQFAQNLIGGFIRGSLAKMEINIREDGQGCALCHIDINDGTYAQKVSSEIYSFPEKIMIEIHFEGFCHQGANWDGDTFQGHRTFKGLSEVLDYIETLDPEPVRQFELVEVEQLAGEVL
jgi:hypothetical protein